MTPEPGEIVAGFGERLAHLGWVQALHVAARSPRATTARMSATWTSSQ